MQLKNLTAQAGSLRMLLVAPDGTRAFDFWSAVAGGSLGNYSLQDGASQMPTASNFTSGTNGPTAANNTDTFTPVPAPQVPASFSVAAPAGSKTFQQAFAGATAHGAWSLFFYDQNGAACPFSSLGSGWCINISPAAGHSTTTTVSSNPNPNVPLGSAVTFTATVASSPTPNLGTVTFTENGSPLTGAPNSGVASVSGGMASISTSFLPEGDHTITASYHDASSTFNDSFGTVTIRVDKATSTPALSGSTWTYCNTAGITIPAGTINLNDFGPAGPNPSNIMVTGLPVRSRRRPSH